MELTLRAAKLFFGFLQFWLPPLMFGLGFLLVTKLAVLSLEAGHPDPTPSILFLAGVIAIKDFK